MSTPINFADLIFAWQDDGPDNQYYLDTESGDIRVVNSNLLDLKDLTDEIERDRERFLFIPKPDPKYLKNDMRAFLETTDVKLRAVLEMAFESPHTLSAFQKILAGHQEEAKRFEQFRVNMLKDRILEWLDANFVDYTEV